MTVAASYMAERLGQQLRHHRGERGSLHESDFRDILRKFLPDCFGVASGEVITATGEVSPQHDVILWNRMTTPVIERTGDIVLIPYEGCLAVVEVTVKLDVTKLRQDAEKIRKLKALAGSDPGVSRPCGFIFGFRSATLPHLQVALQELDATRPVTQWVDSVYSLEKGLISNFHIAAGGATTVAARATSGFTHLHVGLDEERHSGWALTQALLSIYAALRKEVVGRGEELLPMTGWGLPG